MSVKPPETQVPPQPLTDKTLPSITARTIQIDKHTLNDDDPSILSVFAVCSRADYTASNACSSFVSVLGPALRLADLAIAFFVVFCTSIYMNVPFVFEISYVNDRDDMVTPMPRKRP
jgi:hypothetical protein